MTELKLSGKSFDISKREVWEAYQKVKANKGAAGVDGCSIEDFEKDLKGNLYKIWNRMSSGTYFPPAVKAVEIPKAHGAGTRILGVPTVADRVAQTVVAARLEKNVEPKFHDDSYGYRPGRSALDAAGRCRERCWRHDWVIDLDIQKFFDSVPWDLIVKAVEANTDQRWVILYVKRWLQAPVQMPDGTIAERDRGTPQGSAVSPVLANLFLHYAFDAWMAREFPAVPFERYVDDAVVHCVSERQARHVLAALGTGWGKSGCDCTPVRPGSCTARTARGVDRTSTPRSRSWVSRSGPLGAEQGTGSTSLGSCPRSAKTPSRRSAANSASWRLHHRTGHTFKGSRDESTRRARLDAVLRRVLPLGAASLPATHQHLPDALDPQEVQTAQGIPQGQGMLAANHQSVSPAVRPLGMERQSAMIRMIRAV